MLYLRQGIKGKSIIHHADLRPYKVLFKRRKAKDAVFRKYFVPDIRGLLAGTYMKHLFKPFLIILSLILVATTVASCGLFADNSSKQSDDEILTSDAVTLTFSGTDYTISDAEACTVEDSKIVLNKARIYKISGELTDGCIVVRVDKTEKVTLALDGLTATCTTGPVIIVESADKVTISTVSGTTNTLSDGSNYLTDSTTESLPNACIYSKDDLAFNGNGTLIVNGNCKHGIKCNDDLEVKSGKIVISAASNGLRGNDSVTIEGGVIEITQCADGLKASNETKEGKGFILISGGSVTINSSDDALQAPISVTITGGLVSVSAQGDIVNCAGTVNIADGCLVQLD